MIEGHFSIPSQQIATFYFLTFASDHLHHSPYSPTSSASSFIASLAYDDDVDENREKKCEWKNIQFPFAMNSSSIKHTKKKLFGIRKHWKNTQIPFENKFEEIFQPFFLCVIPWMLYSIELLTVCILFSFSPFSYVQVQSICVCVWMEIEIHSSVTREMKWMTKEPKRS